MKIHIVCNDFLQNVFLRFDLVTSFLPDRTHIRNWCRQIFWQSFMVDPLKKETSAVYTVLSKIWPTHWPDMIQFRARPRYYQNKFYHKVLWRSNEKCSLCCVHKDGFLIIWPSVLAFKPILTIFNLDLDIVYKTNILTKVIDDTMKNEASIMCKRFFWDLTTDLFFLSDLA